MIEMIEISGMSMKEKIQAGPRIITEFRTSYFIQFLSINLDYFRFNR